MLTNNEQNIYFNKYKKQDDKEKKRQDFMDTDLETILDQEQIHEFESNNQERQIYSENE